MVEDALHRSKEHLMVALHEAYPGGSHGEMWCNLIKGCALLTAGLDSVPGPVNDLRHLAPWQVRAMETTDGAWDVQLTSGSGPLLRDLVFPLLNRRKGYAPLMGRSEHGTI